MCRVQEAFQKGDVKSFVVGSSIAYGIGFVTVMMHTARLGFPVFGAA